MLEGFFNSKSESLEITSFAIAVKLILLSAGITICIPIRFPVFLFGLESLLISPSIEPMLSSISDTRLTANCSSSPPSLYSKASDNLSMGGNLFS